MHVYVLKVQKIFVCYTMKIDVYALAIKQRFSNPLARINLLLSMAVASEGCILHNFPAKNAKIMIYESFPNRN